VKAFPLEVVWYIITKWTEQSEHLFTQESLNHMEHLVFIEILYFTKKRKEKKKKKENQKTHLV